MTIKHISIVWGVFFALVLGYWSWHKHDKHADNAIISTVLPAGAEEKLIVEPGLHTIQIVKRQGTGVTVTKQYLPSRPSSITVNKNGTVEVVTRNYGTEFSPQFGFAYSDKARVFLGAGVLYYKRVDVVPFLGIGLSGKLDGRPGAAISFNAYSNTHFFVGAQTDGKVIGGISFNF